MKPPTNGNTGYNPPLPSPDELGMPEKFGLWRRGQPEAVLAALDAWESGKRVVMLTMPTGGGKSLTAAAVARLVGQRTGYLTSTKGLQDQVTGDFGGADVRGQQNYRCVELMAGGQFEDDWRETGRLPTVEDGPCHGGTKCGGKDLGCEYYDAVRVAKRAELVTTNYAYWVTQHKYGDGLGKFGLLVLDEAHSAPDDLCSALEIRINGYESRVLMGMGWPKKQTIEGWREWAGKGEMAIALAAAVAGRRGKEIRRLKRKLSAVAGITDDWIALMQQSGAGVEARFAPIWPAQYAESALFTGIPKILLMSATATAKTAELLGVGDGELEIVEVESTFPVKSRPVVWVSGSPRVRHGWSVEAQRGWVRLIDEVVSSRPGKKGIVHCTSYERAKLLMRESRHAESGRLLTHSSGGAVRAVEEFRRRSAESGAVLVSPSMTTGWDFPGDEAEYCIVGKIPFPDSSDPVVAARSKTDKEYGCYTAMQEIVQSTGRGMRSETDRFETIVVDGNWQWFWAKYRGHAPRWWRAAVRTERGVPRALL